MRPTSRPQPKPNSARSFGRKARDRPREQSGLQPDPDGTSALVGAERFCCELSFVQHVYRWAGFASEGPVVAPRGGVAVDAFESTRSSRPLRVSPIDRSCRGTPFQGVARRLRIQSLDAEAATVLPFALVSVDLAPCSRRTAMTRACSSLAASDPESLRPVF